MRAAVSNCDHAGGGTSTVSRMVGRGRWPRHVSAPGWDFTLISFQDRSMRCALTKKATCGQTAARYVSGRIPGSEAAPKTVQSANAYRGRRKSSDHDAELARERYCSVQSHGECAVARKSAPSQNKGNCCT